MNYCKLCQNSTELIKSHIIPEWAYKPLYDEKHRFSSIETRIAKRAIYKQKGLTEKLLCLQCDSGIGRYDEYTRAVIFS